MNKSKGIKRSNLRRASLVAIVLLLCVWMANILARQSQEGKAEPILQKKPKMGTQVNINALLHETQKMSQKVNEMTLVWWIPEAFWRLSSAQDPTITETQVEELIKILRPYTLIVPKQPFEPTFKLKIARGLTIAHLVKIRSARTRGICYR